ncbi:MAG TPA: hypothetical protein PL089_05340 [Ignavibacteria bacterium]|nr:hypothetical protein [Ignavibacteria bacterium]
MGAKRKRTFTIQEIENERNHDFVFRDKHFGNKGKRTFSIGRLVTGKKKTSIKN